MGLAACSTDYMAVPVSSGEWGGANVDLHVTETGATALFKCGAQGTLTAPLVLDSSAHFDVGGTYESKLVKNGPQPATYLGAVTADRLMLTVRLDGQSLGPFDLQLNQAPTFEPCNF
jgi:hypothetical protein